MKKANIFRNIILIKQIEKIITINIKNVINEKSAFSLMIFSEEINCKMNNETINKKWNDKNNETGCVRERSSLEYWLENLETKTDLINILTLLLNAEYK